MKKYQKLMLISLLAVMLMLTACQGVSEEDKTPAQRYCEGLGYKHSVIMTYMGQSTICTFNLIDQCPDTSFLGGNCGQEYTYCTQMGGTIQVAEDGQVGNCVFSDGTVCNEYEFFQGSCTPAG